ncbi:MAG: hypothetical protein ACIAQF_08130 [Phycisphaerales bacterium JB065]
MQHRSLIPLFSGLLTVAVAIFAISTAPPILSISITDDAPDQVSSIAQADPTPVAEKVDGPHPKIPVWAAMELASQGEASPGRFHARLHREGWSFVLNAFQPAYDAGCDVLFLHRVGGEVPHQGQVMNLDSRVELLADPDARKILDAVPQFLDDFHARYPDARIVAYFGSSLEPDLVARLDAQQFSAFIDRYSRSLQPWLNCPWVDIAFDHAGSFRDRDPHGAAILFIDALLHSAGRTVYVEPQPNESSMTASLPFVVQEYWWQRWANKANTNGVRWLEGNSVITHKHWVGDYQGFVDACVKDGMGIAIGPWHFEDLRLPIEPRKKGETDPTKLGPDEKGETKKAA